MKKRFALITIIGAALAGCAYLVHRLDFFHDDRQDYVKFDTSRNR